MAYVDDLVEGTVLAMENEKACGEVINLGNDEEMSVIEAARLIHKIADTGKPIKLKYVKMEDIFGGYKDIKKRRPDLTKAHDLLGYKPRISMKEAIQRMLKCRRKDIGTQTAMDGIMSDIHVNTFQTQTGH
jgi:nucleoside-diphosphate-sugar epimerase